MATDSSAPSSSSSTEPVEEPSAAARLTISARPFQGELKGELHAKVPARETGSMINMIGRLVTAGLLAVAAPALILYLAPGAGLDPTWVTVLVAGNLVLAAVLLLRLNSSSSVRRRSRRSSK